MKNEEREWRGELYDFPRESSLRHANESCFLKQDRNLYQKRGKDV